MHPTLRREIAMARQQDELRAAAGRRLAAEAKNARAVQPSPGGTVTAVPANRTARVLQLRRLLARLLPA